MSKSKPALKEQFRLFYQNNHFSDLEQAINYFAVFGGLSWKIDPSKPLFALIEDLILKRYSDLKRDIMDLTHGRPIYHSVLSGIAMGDGRVHSAFKRARVPSAEGETAVTELIEIGLIGREPEIVKESATKLHFFTPSMRFWFAFISPLFKGIQEGDFKEVRESFEKRAAEFTQTTIEKLLSELLKEQCQEDPIIKIGSYWDKNFEIEMLATTKSGKTIALSFKHSSGKAKKSELSKLKEKCQQAGIEADLFVLYAKEGFSNELKALKGEDLKLYTLKSLKALLNDTHPKK